MAALAAGAVLASCGDDDKSAAPADTGAIELTVRLDRSMNTRRVSTGTLRCASGVQRATGALVDRAPVARLCAEVGILSGFLRAKQPARRVCTQIYGGPQTARITGTIYGRPVNRTFRRTNGCEIEDYARVAKILPR